MSNTENPIQIQKFLAGVDYPAEKSTLVDAAKQQGADSNVLRALIGIPDGSYAKPTEVSQAISDAGNHPERSSEDRSDTGDEAERGGDRFDAG
ncbi:hypothetical protein GCM10027449_07220 [Sinomonas notoginsengisoli]|uniref:DUF2795 domain-containing protein n=1 Tax=Sinomonas notoginsengisoli TaxID=1457311 RepID=UPI0027DF4C55|nr:DUF2795 domain-containing protein [Sinomonas notoginsengisoli]